MTDGNLSGPPSPDGEGYRHAMRRLAIAAVLVAACSSAPVAPITLHAGDNGQVNVPAGRYRFAWTSTCTAFALEYAPTSGTTPIAVSSAPSGTATIELPGGPAYVNRGGSCPADDVVVTIQPAG